MPIQKVTKEEILLKSADVFRLKGYHNTSVQDLADACGLLKGSLYHYFPSKEKLMEELLLSIHNYLKTRVFPIASDTNISPEERMETVLKKMGKLLLEKEGGCLIGNSILETVGVVKGFQAVLQGIIDDWINALTIIFSHNKTPDQALRLAQLTIIEFEGSVMFSKLYSNKQFIYDTFARTMARLQ